MLIAIQWCTGKEYIRIDANELLKAGNWITTTEYWPDCQQTFEYNVYCQESIEIPGGTLRFKLQYDQEKNPDVPNVAWGTSTLEIENWRSPNDRKAKATFDCPALLEYTGDASQCEVINESLFAALPLETVERLMRPKQWAMRRALLEEDRVCVISGEPTEAVLEAAHIIDHADNGSAHTANGILLRADLHRLFDRGILVIGEDGSLAIRDDVDIGDVYRELVASKERLSPGVFSRVKGALKQRNALANS